MIKRTLSWPSTHFGAPVDSGGEQRGPELHLGILSPLTLMTCKQRERSCPQFGLAVSWHFATCSTRKTCGSRIGPSASAGHPCSLIFRDKSYAKRVRIQIWIGPFRGTSHAKCPPRPPRSKFGSGSSSVFRRKLYAKPKFWIEPRSAIIILYKDRGKIQRPLWASPPAPFPLRIF